MIRSLRFAAVALLLCATAAAAQHTSNIRPAAATSRARTVMAALAQSACDHLDAGRLRTGTMRVKNPTTLCGAIDRSSRVSRPNVAPSNGVRLVGSAPGVPDGTLLQRARLIGDGTSAIDLVIYVSDSLIVPGIVCYPDDGQRHSAIIHVHGGTGGIFVNPDGNMLQTCWEWAAIHQRTAFVPSLRGQDNGEGQLELCGGEANDVVAGATMLRTLEMTDTARVAMVGGSVGGCIVLRAGPRIPNLRAVVSFVPPTSWKQMVQYHATSFVPDTETTCSGETINWNVGGAPMVAVVDQVICGKIGCSDADYDARSPLPLAAEQTAPTLIISAERDNLVPLDQQVVYSLVRQSLGHPLAVRIVNPCDASALPPLGDDVHVLVRNGYHTLGVGPIASGMMFMLAKLDAVQPVAFRAPAAPAPPVLRTAAALARSVSRSAVSPSSACRTTPTASTIRVLQ
jgi:hypothetical protein